MYVEGGINPDPVRVHQTASRGWVGHIDTPEGVVTFGPYPWGELLAVMDDWLKVAIREARREIHNLEQLVHERKNGPSTRR